MPVLVFCCFWFQKSCSGNILGVGRHESQSPYFSVTYTESGGESKRGSRAATPRGGAPLGRAARWRGAHGAPPTSPLRLYIHILGKILGTEQNSMKLSTAAVIVNPSSGGFWSSSRHPAGEGNHHRRPLHHHACLWSDAWVVHPWTTGP